jgi:hypothetical protein
MNHSIKLDLTTSKSPYAPDIRDQPTYLGTPHGQVQFPEGELQGLPLLARALQEPTLEERAGSAAGCRSARV